MTRLWSLEETDQRARDLAASHGAAIGAMVHLVKGHLGMLPPFVSAPCAVKVVGIYWLGPFRESGCAEHVLVQVHSAEKMRGGWVRLDRWRDCACLCCLALLTAPTERGAPCNRRLDA